MQRNYMLHTSIRKASLLIAAWCILLTNPMWIFSKTTSEKRTHAIENATTAVNSAAIIETIYDNLNLDSIGLSSQAFTYAFQGYAKLKNSGKLKNDSILTVVDFDQPSYMKRMYVIDIKNTKLLFNTWSAHGKNTGAAVAKDFSNKPESHKSSLGFYLTENTYMGGNGYSMRLIGLEKTNSNAWNRAIVLHGAAYVSRQMIENMGYIGRSYGCPAVSQEVNRPIIDKIKGGSCFFVYHKTYHPTFMRLAILSGLR